MKKINNYEKMTKEELENLLKIQAEKIEKLEKNEKAVEKRLEIKEKLIENLKKEIEEKNSIEANRELYSNAKWLDEARVHAKEYKALYETQYKANKELKKEYQEYIKKMKPIQYNERGAGRKLKANEEKCKKIIMDNKEKSLREIKKILEQNGEKISIMTIGKLKKEN